MMEKILYKHHSGGLRHLLIAVFCFVLTIGLLPRVLAGEPGVSPKQRHCQELLQLGQKLFEVTRKGDIEALIPLLHDKIALWPDSGMTKHEFIRELRKREGRIYAGLFDTKLYKVYEEKWRESRFSPEGRKRLRPIESIKSVKDYLLEAKNVEVKVEFLIGETKDPPALAVVGFDWPGRPSLDDLPNSTFFPTRRGWKIQELFDNRAWGNYAPGVVPGDPAIKTEPQCRALVSDLESGPKPPKRPY